MPNITLHAVGSVYIHNFRHLATHCMLTVVDCHILVFHEPLILNTVKCAPAYILQCYKTEVSFQHKLEQNLV